MENAVSGLKITPDIVITDAIKINISKSRLAVIPIVKGDELSVSIAAASVVAKVIRDRLMLKYSRIFPEYDFGTNKGYGTRKHLATLRKYGPCRIHRISFKGVLN